MSMPKEGTIERAVLDALIAAGPAGLTHLDFPPEIGMTDELLADIVQRLRYAIFESEDDSGLKFDS